MRVAEFNQDTTYLYFLCFLFSLDKENKGSKGVFANFAMFGGETR